MSPPIEGRYRIESELGEGGMATVYLAEDLRHESGSTETGERVPCREELARALPAPGS